MKTKQQLIVLVLCLSLAIPAAPVGRAMSSQFAPVTPGTLSAFGVLLDELAGFEELGTPLPFTAVSPGDQSALHLDGLFSEALAVLEANGWPTSLQGTYGDVEFVFTNVEVSSTDLSFDLRAAVSPTLALDFAIEDPGTGTPGACDDGMDNGGDGVADGEDSDCDNVRLSGGEMATKLELATTFHFELEGDQADLLGTPKIDVTIHSDGPITPFEDHLGFDQVAVTGTSILHPHITVQFVDPDGDGRITQEERDHTALYDLVVVEYAPEDGQAVAVTLDLDSGLVDGTPDGTIALIDPTMIDGLDAPTVQLGSLGDFFHTDADDMLVGLMQVASALITAQNAADVKLPFLQESLGNTYLFAEPLIDVVKQQGEAAILCGTQDTNPPSGDVGDLPAGSRVYCQAVAMETPVEVEWQGATVDLLPTANTTLTSTVGPDPAANAEFTLTQAGTPQVQVAFVDSDGREHLVSQRFEVAADLAEKLLEIGEFDLAEPRYDPSTHTLTYHLVKDTDPRVTYANPDLGNQLQPATGLVGLSPTMTDSVTVDVTSAALDLTFGVILVEDVLDITPSDPITSTLDRYFLQVNNDGYEFKFEDATIDALLELDGQLGFLGVQASGKPGANTANPTTAFEIARANPRLPMLRGDILPPAEGIPVSDYSIPNAVLIADLLLHAQDYVTGAANLKMSAGLEVAAEIGTPADTLASGDVAITWTGFPDSPPLIEPTPGFEQELQVFDLAPSVTGRHHGDPDLALLHDPEANFSSLGETVLLNAPVTNVTDGSTCRVQAIVDAHTLQCPLSGGPQNESGETDNEWDDRDAYVIAGNPQVLMRLLLNNLYDLAGRMESLSGEDTGLDDVLPLVGLTPRDLLPQFGDLRGAIQDIQTGQAGNIPATLQDLDRALKDVLGLPESALEFEVMSLPGANGGGEWMDHLVLDLKFGLCTEGNTAGIVCQPDTKPMPKQNVRLSLDLVPNNLGVNLPPLIAKEENDSLQLEYASLARLEVGIPLSRTQAISGFVVLDSSGVSLDAAVSTEAISLTATAGPLSLRVGQGAGITGAHTPRPMAGTITGLITETQDLTYTLTFTDTAQDFADLGLVAGGTVTNTDSGATCDITFASTSRITCRGVISPSGGVTPTVDSLWWAGSNYTILGPSSRILYDPEKDFGSALVGLEVTRADGVSCTVEAVMDPDSLVCPLPGEQVWAQGDEYRIGGKATARFQAAFDAVKGGIDAEEGNETFTVPEFTSDLQTTLQGPPAPNQCGDGLEGDACARLSLNLVDNGSEDYLGEVLLGAPLSGTAAVTITQALKDAIYNHQMDWTLLTLGLEMLPNELRSQLDGIASGTQLPIIGADLDAGAEVPDVVEGLVGNLATLGPGLYEITDPDLISSTVSTEIETAINATLGLSQTGTIDVEVGCDGACAEMWEINKVQVTFGIGKGLADASEVPGKGCDPASGRCDQAETTFDIGLLGMTLESDEDDKAVGTSYAWRLEVGFGLSRDHGSYLVVNGGGEPDFQLGASATVKERAVLPPTCDFPYEDPPELTSFDDNRCFEGLLGYLPTTFWADADTPSDLNLRTKIDLGIGSDVLTMDQLLTGAAVHQLEIDAEAAVHLRFRTGTGEWDYGFPSVVGTFDMDATGTFTKTVWYEKVGLAITDPAFDHLYLDLGIIREQFVQPVADGIHDVFGPILPVIDVLRTPVPILSDLSKAAGQGPVTPMSLLPNVPPMVENLIEFIEYMEDIPPDSGLLPLGTGGQGGSFDVNAALALLDPSEWGLPGGPGDITFTEQTGLIADAKFDGGASASAGFYLDRPSSLAFPFLNDPREIATVLVGGDAVLVRFDAGQMTAFGNVTFSFNIIGPLWGNFGLMLSVTGQFAMGYSTRGLRLAATGESTASVGEILLDGIFIDDLNADGQDVPELKVTLTVSAWASLKFDIEVVSIEFAVEAGLDFIVELNLNDSPVPDGKLYIEEIYDKLLNPICLFDVTFKIEWFLRAWLEISVGIPKTPFRITKKWTVEYRPKPPLFEVDLLKCNPGEANLADLEYMDGDSIKDLRLNMGSETLRGVRNVARTMEDETFIVRQLTPEGAYTFPAWMIALNPALAGERWTQVSVTAFGVTQYELIPEDGIVVAHGDSKKDSISMLPGADPDGNEIPFTLTAELHGGPGRDRLQGGEGDDYLYGDDDADNLFGNGGVDTLYGGDGDDAIDAGTEDDTVDGGKGNDRIQGGPGTDTLHGGDDDDVIDGGPGLPASQEEQFPDLIDKVDYIYGDAGDDTLKGGFGDDKMWGGTGQDDIDGGQGNDTVYGGPDDDRIAGELGDDTLYGDEGNDLLVGDYLQRTTSIDGNDTLYGGPDKDTLFGRGGNDELHGDGDHDDLLGGGGHDFLDGGDGDDIVMGDEGLVGEHAHTIDSTLTLTDVLALAVPENAPSEDDSEPEEDTVDCASFRDLPEGRADCLFGGEGQDYLFGEWGDDKLFGGDGSDYMEGNAGMDLMDGNDGADTMRGGQHGDTMYGGRYAYPLSTGTYTDTKETEQYTPYDLGDTMVGDSGNDTMYGDAGNDVMRGGTGDDTMEGNQGSDEMYGDANQDDLIGGTSGPGVEDGDDWIQGNAGHDVLAGDNASITRTGGTQDFSAEVSGVPLREVTLYDVAEVGAPLPSPIASGKDVMWGDAGFDLMYGQGNGEMAAGPVVDLCNGLDDDGNGIVDDEERSGDCMHGGDGPDYMEGNAGGDSMYGDTGEDDLLGGTGRIAGDPEDGMDGRLDGADRMHGGPGSDFMAGDNALLRRTLVDGQWSLAPNGGLLHEPIFLREVNWDAGSQVSGGDEMYGDGQNDVLYGQGSDDTLYGGDDHDYLEGNAGSDLMEGNAGQDDLIGGTGLVDHDLPPDQVWFLDAGDWMYGEAGEGDGDTDGDGADVMLGDNGTITHPLTDGAWATNSFNGAYTRETVLLDVATLAVTPAPGTSGGDHMWGNDNDDLMYGQGDEDEMYGGAGDDHMEGNAASDRMYGNRDDDDMIGGTGRINEDPPEGMPGRIDRSTNTRDLTYAYPDSPPETVTVSLGDQMFGGEGSDVMLGDNGIISRASDTWQLLEYRLLADSFGDEAPRHYLSEVEGRRAGREVRMIDTAPGAIAGSDLMFGGPGEDDLYGQFDDSDGLDLQSELIVASTIGDELYGEEGEDAMLGDNGVVENRVLGDPTQYIAPHEPFFDDERFVQGSLFRETTLAFAAMGGHDRLLGGPGGDWMHGGAGNDLMNGNAGNDRLFGDDGSDVMWGGFHHDHLYGGYGKDYLDVKPRPEMTVGKKNQQMTLPPDLVEWFVFGQDANHEDNYEGIDYLYGGWGQDALQADQAAHGPVPGDRLIDWVGAYNVFYLCPALYGEFLVTRDHSPAIIEFLQQLAEGDGAVEPANRDASGFGEVAIVFPKEAKDNSHPVHEDNPGHFTCVQSAPPDLAIDVTDGQAVAVPGQILTYTLAVGNLGPSEATGIAIREVLPSGTTFLAASDGGAHAEGIVLWPTFSLARGTSASRSVSVRLDDRWPAGIEEIASQAAVVDDGSRGPDVNPGDNQAWDSTSLEAAPDLQLAMHDGGLRAGPGQVISYTLGYANRGNQGAVGVVLAEMVPSHSTFLASASSGGWSCADGSPAGTACTLAVGDLAAGSSDVARFAVVAIDPLPAEVNAITNTAFLGDDDLNGPDPEPADNQALVVTPVNHPPEAQADSFVVAEDSLDNLLDVLQNDLDVDGDELAITTVSTATHGTVIQTATSLVYTPPAGFSGTDLFTYTLSDGTLTVTAPVTVVVEPPAVTGDEVGWRQTAWTIF